MHLIQEQEETPEAFRGRVAKDAEMWGAMMRTEGWKTYEAYLRAEAASMLQSLANAKTADESHKAGAAYTTLTRVVDLPRQQYEGSLKLLHSK